MLCATTIQPDLDTVQFEEFCNQHQQYTIAELAQMYASFLWMDSNKEDFDSMSEGGLAALKQQFERTYVDDLPF